MNTTKVSVTQKHIDSGLRMDGCECAVALALLDALRAEGTCVTYLHVGIGPSAEDATPYDGWRAFIAVPVGDPEEDVRRHFAATLGRDVIDWIAAFDGELPVQPFEVELTWTEADA